MHISEIVVISLVALLIGLSKGGMGAALAIVVTPLLSLVMPVQHAISLALPLLLVGDIIAVGIFWKQWDARYLSKMIPTAVLGVAIGTVLLRLLPDLALRLVLGLLTLLYVVYRLASARLSALQLQPRGWHAPVAGGASGMFSALANTGAPPFTAYLLTQPLSPQAFVGTTTLFFAVVNGLKLPGQVAVGLFDLNDLLRAAWVLPIIPVGVLVGKWLVTRIEAAVFERLMLAVLLFAAFILIFVSPR